MNFSVAKVRPFRSLGLYRSSGKHAARRGGAQLPMDPAVAVAARRPAHAAPARPGGAARQKTAGPRGKAA
jgi:hypothetical protein